MYRPRYPEGVLRKLGSEIDFDARAVVADVGSGTGILSKLFLDNGNRVYCVEPNKEMRRVAEEDLSAYRPRFVSVDATAEATGLDDGSVDLVTVGQALHWFDFANARKEFQRILKRTGHLLVIYNWRRSDTLADRAYTRLARRFANNMADVPGVDSAYVARFIGSKKIRRLIVPNRQVLDFEGLLGRLASASYAPAQGSPEWARLEKDVERIVSRHGRRGKVVLHYHTAMYIGQFQ